jgi:hypothetical protein
MSRFDLPSRCRVDPSQQPSSQFSSQLLPFTPVRRDFGAAVRRSLRRPEPRRTVGQATWKASWVHALAGSNPASSAPGQHKKAPPDLRGPGGGFADVVSVLVSVGLWRRPEEPADSARDLMPDGIGYVLVARGHRRRRPAHHAHDCAFRHLKGQEHGCSCVPGVVQSCFSHARPLQ